MSRKKKYILVCTDYVTKWVEDKALFRATEKSVVEFIYEEIFTLFGVPIQIVTDNGTQFTSKINARAHYEVWYPTLQVFTLPSSG